MSCNCIVDNPKTTCELCNKYFCDNCMYLICHICHKKFTCFGCGSQERQKYFLNLPCAVINKYAYMNCCKKHINYKIINVNDCQQPNCKLCK